ncbi:MAG TPA: hypothetical protein VJ111_01095 [Chitinophagaceae bacterium]|nr:hypothetical protein [Chitinophagaceae bacterium]
MHDDYCMTDFNGGKYKIDYDDNPISYEESDYYKQESVTVLMKPQNRVESFGSFPASR